MNEIFRFMTMRSAQLVEPSTAIDLSTFINAGSASSTAGVTSTTPQGRAAVASNQAMFAKPVVLSSLNYAPTYRSISSEILASGFDATQTLSVITNALGNTPLSDWVNVSNNSQYAQDKNDAAIALIAAHLRPNGDSTAETAATYVRLMNLIEALAAAETIADTAALTRYFKKTILAPSGVFPLLQAGPPYNPYVVPAGIADLQIVKQELLGYDKKEVSFIANILQSESNKRVTVRFEKTDQTFTSSSTTTTQTEQDTQSTQRFQVQTQAQQTIQQNANLKFGVSVSASYGPSVSVKSNLDYGNSTSQTDSNSTSMSYAKDITTQSVSRVTQQITQSQTLDVINSFREQIEHGFDNANGTTNISGVYQYVDALYEVGVYNYGQRLFLDLIVPDPAAFIRDAIVAVNGSAVSVYNPPPITFTPSELTLPLSLLPTNSVSYNQNTSYPVGTIVSYGGALYLSLQANNTNNEPDTSPGWWSAIPLLAWSAPQYGAATTYDQNDIVGYSGVLYKSLQGANTTNEPDTSPSWWSPVSVVGNLYPSVAQYYVIQNLQFPSNRAGRPKDYTQAAQIYQSRSGKFMNDCRGVAA